MFLQDGEQHLPEAAQSVGHHGCYKLFGYQLDSAANDEPCWDYYP